MLLLKRSKQRPGRGFGVEGGGLPSWGLADPVVAAPSSAVAVLQHGNGGEGEGLGRLGLVGSGLVHYVQISQFGMVWFGLVWFGVHQGKVVKDVSVEG